MAMLRLETATRWYLCAAQESLIGWELWRAWGGKRSPTGGTMVEPAVDKEHAELLLARVLKMRLAHGYRPVAASG